MTSDYDKYFPEETKLFYNIMSGYVNLNDTMYPEAFKLAQEALELSDRYNTIGNDASKLGSIKEAKKTDIKGFFYGRYRTLQLVHEHCRMIWGRGERETRERIR